MIKRILVILALVALASPAAAQRLSQLPTLGQPQPVATGETGIAAVVNDNVITTTDLDQRLRLAVLSSGLPDNPEVRRHLLPQILRGLIDEQLETQEAKRLDLSVSKEEIDQALSHIAHDNHIQGDMLDYVTSHGASSDALVSQIRNGLLWNKVVQRELRPKVEIGDDEIDAVINRVRANAGKEEYLVSEILLPVDNPKDEDQVKQVADNLVNQLKNGANFSAIARQFSQGADAAQGGDLGWIQQGQLANELNQALAASSPGMVSDPIRTASGFHILGVRDKRTVSLGDPGKITLNVTQAFRPYGAQEDHRVAMAEASHFHNTVKGCDTLTQALQSFPGWKIEKLGDINAATAPKVLADKLRDINVGDSSDPLATDKGAVVIFVCDRKDNSAVDRDAILHSIGTEKLELEARRLLRDLRRAAYLDIRLGKS